MIAPSDYHRIERAIAWLDAHAESRPSLADAAGAAGLSTAHFQKVFTHWVGISPKRFLQARTAHEALRLLREGRSTLDVTYEAGLTSQSRLHELVLHAEAVTPGDLKRRGEGLRIRYGWHATPFGDALLAATQHGLCFVAFADTGERRAVVADLERRWPAAEVARDDDALAPFAARAFPTSVRRGGPLALHVRGTNFQLKVWNALLSIPVGATTTYARIAHSIGEPSAPRAVGNAVGANPISWLIPCHRVLRGDGGLGGYAWGPERKRVMLAWEGIRGREDEKTRRRGEDEIG